ncbi:nucleotidyltransferase domain-containing protein [Peptococcaceae bacterium 1198_IL3148]
MEALIPKLKQVLQNRKNIAAVYIFGSYGSSEYQTAYSDIDLGVIFLPDVQIG